MMKRRKFIDTIGDSNFLEHNGGIVFLDQDGDPRLAYFQSLPSDCIPSGKKGPMWIVSDIMLDTDYLDWVDKSDVASSIGMPRAEFENYIKSDDPITLANVFESVGQYFGFGNLDPYPQILTKTQIRRRFGKWIDK